MNTRALLFFLQIYFLMKESTHDLISFRDIMIQGGNAIDSVIATLLCVGVVNPQSSGIGGGFLMTLYNKSVSVLIFLQKFGIQNHWTMPRDQC